MGDALGERFEGWSTRSTVRLSRDDILAKYRGVYTDDTEMMIILAETILSEGRLNATVFVKELAARFNPGRGYGRGTTLVLRQILRGVEWREASGRVFGSGSYGNGGSIRVAPVSLAYYDNRETLLKAAEYSCVVTHSHPLGVEGCLVQAYAIGLALKGLDKDEILEEGSRIAKSRVFTEKLSKVRELLEEEADLEKAAYTLGNFSTAQGSVPLSLYLFLRSTDFEDAVISAVRCGGDTDSVAAMTGALAGAYYGYESIPGELLDKLEDKDRITKLADDLWEMKNEGRILEPVL